MLVGHKKTPRGALIYHYLAEAQTAHQLFQRMSFDNFIK